jgi:hypothetical protein
MAITIEEFKPIDAMRAAHPESVRGMSAAT